MSQLVHEVNDSVFFIAGEGLFIELVGSGHRGYYDIRGIETLLIKAMQAGENTDQLEDARSILQTYLHRMHDPLDTPIPHATDSFTNTKPTAS